MTRKGSQLRLNSLSFAIYNKVWGDYTALRRGGAATLWLGVEGDAVEEVGAGFFPGDVDVR